MEDTTPPDKRESLREQSGAVVSDVRAAVLHATRHLEALTELLQLELREYGSAQVQRVALMAAGAVLLVVAYVFFWLAVCIVCSVEWGMWGGYAAFALALLCNGIVGLWLLCRGIKRKPAGLAPATCRELKDDLQCIKLYLKGKEQS